MILSKLKQEVEKNVKALLLLSSLDGNNDGLNNVSSSSKSVCAAIQIATTEMTLETSGREGLGKRTSRRKRFLLRTSIFPRPDTMIQEKKLRHKFDIFILNADAPSLTNKQFLMPKED